MLFAHLNAWHDVAVTSMAAYGLGRIAGTTVLTNLFSTC